ncbi:hypothetical protein Kpol_367p5 [Vanderwaltozyma polyspora DSM 70294]|uniref:Cyclin-like domain-containing protein n=1 Tax=Vanderwaltozyma polyspora (strain ATCC 22028 / DSM 70294 / BCRC 21397 / CBS 2163 / NBRC 10782 / NRRL Y-8283 / UCD 57-17) TaxID=436907 RepID=A7TRQ6_VANPO|nr:uncharacterized protein Kpol_367p5 [Vanderwaltozyma polyspora DSM 70294]EDO15050.1 hypothetical protein Kpol_367p5 [Vanderwaltozyma polyspora DSM 70294]
MNVSTTTIINNDNVKVVDSLPNLHHLAHIRRNVARSKAANPSLLKNQFNVHRISVLEYSKSLLNHLIRLEDSTNLEYPLIINNFKAQPQINDKMRNLIIDFIICCHTRLKLSSSTLFLTIDLLNRYSSKFIIKCNNYQLFALTALWISSKYWDSKNKIPNFNILTSLCCNQFTPTQFKEIEWHLLTSLNWSILQNPTTDYFIDLLLVIDNNNSSQNLNPIYWKNSNLNLNEIKSGAILLAELASFDLNLSFSYNSSAIALASITLITLALNFHDLNNWENYHVDSKDANLNKICDKLLFLATDKDAFPSSFKFKYLNDQQKNSTTAAVTNTNLNNGNKILTALSNYYLQLQFEEFYNSQEFNNLANSINDNLINDQNIMHSNNEFMKTNQDSSSNCMKGRMNIYSNHSNYNDKHYNNSNINITNNSPHSVSSSTSSSAISTFASPDSAMTAESDKEISSSTSSLLPNSLLLLPLTPTTPTLFQVDTKSSEKKRLMTLNSINNNNNFSKQDNQASARSNPIVNIPASSGIRTFVKGHIKRSSSSMDIDFFDTDMDYKRNPNRY